MIDAAITLDRQLDSGAPTLAVPRPAAQAPGWSPQKTGAGAQVTA
jgi:hypothetical protein